MAATWTAECLVLVKIAKSSMGATSRRVPAVLLKALLPTEYAISASIIIDCRIQKKDWRMFRSDQMSLVVPLCGAIRRLACTDMTWRSLVSTSVRMTRIILMHVPRCGRPACLFSERFHTLSDGERVRWKTSQERKQCSTKRTCDGKLSLNDQSCGRVGMRGQTSQTTCMSAAQQ